MSVLKSKEGKDELQSTSKRRFFSRTLMFSLFCVCCNFLYSSKQLARNHTSKYKLHICLVISCSSETHENATQTKNLHLQVEALKDAIKREEAYPLLTLFTTLTPKLTKQVVYNNTIKNWKELHPFVRPVLFTDEQQLARSVKSFLPVSKFAVGLPVLKFMYLDAIKMFKSTFYGYANGDILFTKGLVETLVAIRGLQSNLKKPLLVVGLRTNVPNVTQDEASSFAKIKSTAIKRGKLFFPGIDYFITMENYPWRDCPAMVIGRVRFDGWIAWNARKHGFTTIDATKTLLAVHQTTGAGNFESELAPNWLYNEKLLQQLYGKIKVFGGKAFCTSLYTDLTSSGQQMLVKRNFYKNKCFPL